MENDLVKKSSSDFSGNLKCPSSTLEVEQHLKLESNPKPEADTQDLHVEKTADHLEGTLPENDSKTAHERKKYHNISNDIRMQLIDAVEGHGEKIKHAAHRLDINYSSAKSIFQVFKREGRTDKKIYKKRVHKDRQVSKHLDTSVRTDDKSSIPKTDLLGNPREFQEPLVQKRVQTESLNIQTPNPLRNFVHYNADANGSQVSFHEAQKLNASNIAPNQATFVRVGKPGEYANFQSQTPIIYMNINGTINTMNGTSNVNTKNTVNSMSTINSMSTTNSMSSINSMSNGIATSTQVNFTNANTPKQVTTGFQTYGMGQFNGQTAYPIYFTPNQNSVNAYPVMMQPASLNNFTPQNQQQHVIVQQSHFQPMQVQPFQPYQPVVVYILPAGSNFQYAPQSYFEGGNVSKISTNTTNTTHMSSNQTNSGPNNQNVNSSYFFMHKMADAPEKWEKVPLDQQPDQTSPAIVKMTTE